MFKAFHVDGPFTEIKMQLYEFNIDFLYQKPLPISAFSQKKEINFIIKDTQKDIVKFLEIIFLHNQKSKNTNQKKVKLYNNHLSSTNSCELVPSVFIELYIEGEKITFLKELQNKRIKYILETTNPKINENHVAMNMMIHHQHLFQVLEMIEKRNRKLEENGEGPMIVHCKSPIQKEQISSREELLVTVQEHPDIQKNLDIIEYFLPYCQFQIFYNAKTNQIRVFGQENNIHKQIAQFAKSNPRSFQEEEIVRAVNEFLSSLENDKRKRNLKKA